MLFFLVNSLLKKQELHDFKSPHFEILEKICTLNQDLDPKSQSSQAIESRKRLFYSKKGMAKS